MKPNDFIAIAQLLLMWSFQDIVELVDIPKYLICETQLSGKQLIVYFVLSMLSLLEIYIMEHLCRCFISSSRHSPIIQVDHGPPIFGWHHL